MKSTLPGKMIFVITVGITACFGLLVFNLSGITKQSVQQSAPFPRGDQYLNTTNRPVDERVFFHSCDCYKENYDNSVFGILDWPIIRKRYLPNYFLRGKHNGLTADYQSGNIVFLHHNKAGGSTVKSVISSLGSAYDIPINLISDHNMIRITAGYRQKGFTSTRTFFIGDYNFGICDVLTNRPCSYFTLIREPFRRVISSYYYCRQSKDQLCGPINARSVSLDDWAIYQGSYFFGQLLMHPYVCASNFTKYIIKYKQVSNSTFEYDMRRSCWFREKAYLQLKLSTQERERVLDYCLYNLPNWFAVIGILEEFNTTLRMLDEVFALPFSGWTGQIMNSHTRKSFPFHDLDIKNMIENLKQNVSVGKALNEDIAIYKAMTEIFRKQKMKMR